MDGHTWTRKDYLDHKCDHAQYWSQFVTETLRSRVLTTFTAERLKEAYNDGVDDYPLGRHLNFIPMKEWDALDWAATNALHATAVNGVYLSDANLVCVLKEAAREAIGIGPDVWEE